MLSINSKCDFCSQNLTNNKFYKPISTKRGVKVFQCPKCLLLQSSYTKKYKSRPKGSMSANADRSSIRYTKTLISDEYKKLLKKYTNKNISKILDVGSNMGIFTNFALQYYINSEIYCVEPYKKITTYFSQNRINGFTNRIENIKLKENYFDLIYCVHTLEHTSSIKSVLEKLNYSLNENGILLIGVPNTLLYKNLIEEIFIDTHTFHFTFNSLINYINLLNFQIIYKGNKNHNDLIFLLKKNKNNKTKKKKLLLDKNFSFPKYSRIINTNRKKIENLVIKIKKLSQKKIILIWGAGRIFDTLIKFGQLKPSKNILLYDKFLKKVPKNKYNFKIINEEKLLNIKRNKTIVLIASRDYSRQIIQVIKKIGFEKYINFDSNKINEIK